jgi:hypothetical protein
MAEYGTAQYYRESIDEEKIKKEILLNALQNVAKENKDLQMIEIIADKIVRVNSDIAWKQRQLEEALAKENETEPSEVE